MSGVGSSTRSGGPSAFFSLRSPAALGRKSATAAAMTMTSAPAARASTAASMSAAVSSRITSAPGGPGPSAEVTRVTWAPRAAAASAMAWPCLPDDRLPMKRTGSMGSRVPPAVTRMRTPARSRCDREPEHRCGGGHDLGRVGQAARRPRHRRPGGRRPARRRGRRAGAAGPGCPAPPGAPTSRCAWPGTPARAPGWPAGWRSAGRRRCRRRRRRGAGRWPAPR